MMEIRDYQKLDALDMAELVAKREVDPTELLDCALSMVSATQENLNAVAHYRPDMGGRSYENRHSGIFRGIPFLVKEQLPFPGLITAAGSRLFSAYVPPTGSEYTAQIDRSGLITFGNTTCSELGLLGSTETNLHGTTHNPWNREFSAAGSSGGSAAAVAAGIVPMAHASDAGGSIRYPASVCGVFGFKPSAGRTVASMDKAAVGPLATLVSEHCITKTVRDSAAFLSITEQKGSGALYKPLGFCQPNREKSFHVGVYTKTLMGAEAEPEVIQAMEKAVVLCSELGHHLEMLKEPSIDGRKVSTAFFVLAGSLIDQVVNLMEPMLNRRVNENDLEPFTLGLLDWYRRLQRNALNEALFILKTASATMLTYSESFDVLLCPTLATSPKPLGFLSPQLHRETLIQRTEEVVGFTPIHNISGMCAMSVPLYTNEVGMPIGIHFAAKPGDERLLFDLAYQLETAAPWKDRLPYNTGIFTS